MYEIIVINTDINCSELLDSYGSRMSDMTWYIDSMESFHEFMEYAVLCNAEFWIAWPSKNRTLVKFTQVF